MDRGGSPPTLAGSLLTLDRGNTTLDCRLLGDSGGVRRSRLRVGSSAAAVGEALAGFLAGDLPSAACGVSVVAGGLDAAAGWLAALGIDLVRAGTDLPCPLRLAYPDPGELGADRWVGALAAWRAFGDAVVVDCGTALTVNAVDRDGSFLGGSIGVGLGTLAQALRQRAPALPAFDGEPPAAVPAVTTLDAVRAGVGQGFAAGVRDLVAACLAAFPEPAAVRVGVTGGDAPVLLRLLAAPVGRSVVDPTPGAAWAHWPELIHDGLVALWQGRGWEASER